MGIMARGGFGGGGAAGESSGGAAGGGGGYCGGAGGGAGGAVGSCWVPRGGVAKLRGHSEKWRREGDGRRHWLYRRCDGRVVITYAEAREQQGQQQEDSFLAVSHDSWGNSCTARAGCWFGSQW